MKEDDFKQYQEIIENTIKLRKKENNVFEQDLSGANDDKRQKDGPLGTNKPTGNGIEVCECLGNIWQKFCGCCIKENRNNNTKIDKDFINNYKKINID